MSRQRLELCETPDEPQKVPRHVPDREPKNTPDLRGGFQRWHVSTQAVTEDEAWFVTYLDIITLLLVMMVVLLVFSEPGTSPASTQDASSAASASTSATQYASTPSEAPSANPLEGLPLDQLGDDVQVVVQKGVVSFRINSEVLFQSGNAEIVGGGPRVLDKLMPILKAAATQRVLIEGHTDNVPINNLRYPSNWELSGGRAATVARYLIERGLDPGRVQASGFADTRPISDNDRPQGRAQNRRVEFVLQSGQSASVGH